MDGGHRDEVEQTWVVLLFNSRELTELPPSPFQLELRHSLVPGPHAAYREITHTSQILYKDTFYSTINVTSFFFKELKRKNIVIN